MKRLVTVLAVTLAMTSVWSGQAIALRESRRAAPGRPMVVALQPGVKITPLLTSGDRVGANFQFTGVPDGIGIYPSGAGRLEVFINHELSYRYGDPAWSRVSHLTLDADGAVVAASYAVDGTERYEYFCSSTLDVIDGVPWYFTGEEWFASPRGGMSIAINTLTGEVIETPHFGSITTRTWFRSRAWPARRCSCPRIRSASVRRPMRTSPRTSTAPSTGTAP